MATVKDLLKLATTAAVGTLACQGGAQARHASGSAPANDFRSSPLDSLDPTASPADYHDYDGYGDHSDAPAPALPYFNSTGNSTSDVPCFDIELDAALALLVVGADGPVHATNCQGINDINHDIITDGLEGLFAPQVVTADGYVEGIFASLEHELQSLGDFTNSPHACDNVTTYNSRVIESVDNLYETLSLLDNVTICEPYIN